MGTCFNSFLFTGDTYVSPDNLRDAASRIFTRNHEKRASLGGPTSQLTKPQTQQPQYPSPAQRQQQQQENHYYNTQRFGSAPPQQQQHPHPQDELSKRHSYANHSFSGKTAAAKTPPVVPPKPGSRSTSRERLQNSMEEVDNLDAECKHILNRSMNNGGTPAGLGNRFSLSGTTPPLPALSPDPNSLEASPANNMGGRRPGEDKSVAKPSHVKPAEKRPGISVSNTKTGGSTKLPGMSVSVRKFSAQNGANDNASSQITGLTADLESVLGLQTDLTSDDDESTTVDMTDANQIRQQLDGLEGMYSEVLKLLGLKKYGRIPPPSHPHHQAGFGEGSFGGGPAGLRRRKLYGSMSSLPSVSSIGSRHIGSYAAKDRRAKRPGSGGGGRDKSTNKRLQRLESHVVTLARSVAHLSSEMRSQQALVQEMESLRQEMGQLRGAMGGGANAGRFVGGYVEPEAFFTQSAGAQGQPGQPGQAAILAASKARMNTPQARRVKKLTQFFGEEPPLLRLFLKNLGYEKYAGGFEEAKIGLLELPYLSEERLEKLGIPMGPRMRILQEAKMSAGVASPNKVPPSAPSAGRTDGNNMSFYIL